jgi:serine/threonine-protein kinase HipA
MRQLDLPMSQIEEQYRRMTFNIIARNQDDHVKNIAFLMDRQGRWRLSPAFDLAYSYNPTGAWTARHQMSLNGRRDGFDREDLIAFANTGGVKRKRARSILAEVSAAVADWRDHAEAAGLPEDDRVRIERTHRRELFA